MFEIHQTQSLATQSLNSIGGREMLFRQCIGMHVITMEMNVSVRRLKWFLRVCISYLCVEIKEVFSEKLSFRFGNYNVLKR